MSEALPAVYIARHGETAWSLSGQHTGLTDLPLTLNGERNARRLGERLKSMTFAKVFTSPLQRAAQTCELAGFGTAAETDSDLVEWNYGQYEGLRSAEILAKRPDWQLFRDGAPGGESPAQVGERADRVVKRVRTVPGCVALCQRTFHSRFRRPVAGARPRICGQVFSAEHGEPERGRVRTQSFSAGDPFLE
jgi:broad specificity phosphatase PhoE